MLPSLHSVVIMFTGHLQRKNSYHSPAVDPIALVFQGSSHFVMVFVKSISSPHTLVSMVNDTLGCKACTAQSEINFRFV